MTSPEQYTPIRLVESPDTQPEHLPYAGMVVMVPPGYPLGSGSTNPSRLLGIHGWTQTGTGNPPTEWVMSSVLDASTVAFIRTIPPTGWGDLAQRTVYRQQVRRMIQAGLSAADARDIARLLYLAAAANELVAPPPED